MKRIKLTKKERTIENALLKGDYQKVPKSEFQSIANMIAARRKDAVLNIRINSDDLTQLKKKAEKLGVKYQTFISELLRRIAHNA
ncbi:MAG: hypothetical protein A3C35_05245 [Omnitrophica bacterium RIFCSPHIGHO2_02_FULL_46_11]|nr:MAG: hypothetical protein A3A81_00220 [Omnitrophica bacterium RIFCSPLOWO2_01_FULL_45_10b]OGW86807.1 MAG: hypothetical protein A3C35_05245 [Omnitrophica bacterium RIFCSPHIGHO2_02_FULL_46_11]